MRRERETRSLLGVQACVKSEYNPTGFFQELAPVLAQK